MFGVFEVRYFGVRSKTNFDCMYVLFLRNRVAVQLQKNLDRIRLKRVAAKMKNGCAGGYIISSHPSGMIMCTTNVQNDEGIEEEISYLGTTLFGQKKQKLAKSGTSYSSMWGFYK